MPRKRKSGGAGSEDGGVGYGRPPARHRIGAGEVRNPWGRRGKPKPAVDFLDELVPVQIKGQARMVTRAAALDYFLFARASKGDVRAVLVLDGRSQARRQGASLPTGGALSSDEQAAFDRFLRREAAKLAKGGAR